MQVMFEDNTNAVVIMSNEDHFHLNSLVNKQNFLYWSHQQPHIIHQRSLHSVCLTLWCAVASFCVIGLYFFGENSVTVIANSACYVHMLNTFFLPQLWRWWINMRNVYFQHDGATLHTANASMAVVWNLFPRYLMLCFGDMPWPPRSPDLSACDFFLGGTWNNVHKPWTLSWKMPLQNRWVWLTKSY